MDGSTCSVRSIDRVDSDLPDEAVSVPYLQSQLPKSKLPWTSQSEQEVPFPFLRKKGEHFVAGTGR
jgi:hypothetical protein